MCNSSGYLIEWAMAIQTDYKEKKISYNKAIDLLIKIGYNTINSKEFLGDNMKEFDFYFTVPCSFSYVIKAKNEKEAREKLLTGDYEGDLDLKESNYNNATLDEVR